MHNNSVLLLLLHFLQNQNTYKTLA